MPPSSNKQDSPGLQITTSLSKRHFHLMAASSSQPVPQRLANRDRLIRFYRRYDPSRVYHVDSLLAKFEHFEKDMFQALVDKYGPEPDSTGPIHVKPNRERLKLRIYNFYRYHNPEKLGMVDELADGYWEDGEETLFDSLIARYGPEPMVTSTGDVRRAPKRHRGMALLVKQQRAGAPSSSTTPNTAATSAAPVLPKAATGAVFDLGMPRNQSVAPKVQCSAAGDDGMASDEDDIDDFLLGHNSDEDLLVATDKPRKGSAAVAPRETLIDRDELI